MKGLWIRVEAHEADSVAVARLAEALGIDVITALGHYVALGGAIAEHAPDGNIVNVPDAAIERWGRWSGKRNKFAPVVREIFQAEDGEFADWLETMGKLVERRDKERARKSGGNSAETPQPQRGNSGATERNGTERNGTSPLEAFQPTFKTRGGEAAADDPKTRSAPPADAGNATADPHRDTTRFLDTYYPTHDRRRGDVERQMAATLTVGAKLDRNTLIRAGSVDRLAAKCRETIDEGVRDADKAIVVLLRKLADTSDGSAPGVTVAKADADEQRRDEQTTAADEAAAERWLNDHLAVAASIEEQLNRDGLAGDDDFTRMSRRVARRTLVIAAWSKAELPRARNG
jgi:hypothetical protein